MQPMDTLDLSTLQSKLEVASLTNQQQSPRPDESSPVAFLNSPRSPAAMAGEPQPQSETAVQQQPQPDFLKHSKVRKERRRNKTSSAANLAEHEPTRTCKRIRLRHKEEEEGPEKKVKDVEENNEAAVVVADAKSAPRVWNLRPRKVPEHMQNKGELVSGSKADLKAALEKIKKFSVSLTKKEIDEDFMLMTGKKPPLKPNKRSQEEKQSIVGLKMGSRLKSVSLETYAVREGPSSKWIR